MTDRDLFIAALDHSDSDARAGFLDRHCSGDPDRRRRVEVLLKAHDEASRFLADPPGPPVEPDGPTRTAPVGDDTSPTAGLDVRDYLNPAGKLGLLGTLDHYEVIEEVGRGGMGVVLKAFDPKLHRLIALKLMAPHLAAHGAARKRFEREARAVAAVRNEHVVAIHGVETDDPAPYLVMEFVGGISLQDRLERSGPLDVKEVLRIGMQTARGLAAAHAQGIVHRDIKPANILLENGVERVKITDFGLARIADDANRTQSGVITGTPNYMSPEQAAGGATDARSDLFSLGGVLYALCTGHPPFRAETPLAVLRRVCDDPVRPVRQVNPDVPDWLEAIVHKLLAKNPAERFQTAAEVAELLGQHLAHLQQPLAVPMPAPVDGGERGWREILVATDRNTRAVQLGLMLGGLLLIPLTFVFLATDVTESPILFLVGLALMFAGAGLVNQRFGVPYKGRTVWFYYAPLTGGRLFVDRVKIARTRIGHFRELDGTIPDTGDDIRVDIQIGFWTVGCRIAVREGGSVAPARPPAPVGTPAVVPVGLDRSPTPAGGCLVPLAIVAAVGLLVGFRDTIWSGVVKPGFWAPAYMLLWTAIVGFLYGWARRRAKPGWDRRRWEAGLVVLGGCTVIALLALADRPHWGRLSEALDWHTIGLIGSCLVINLPLIPQGVRWVWRLLRETSPGPYPPAPARDLWTAVVLRGGVLAIVVGLAITGLFISFATGSDKAEGLAGLLAGWGLVALMMFGFGVFITRLRWRRQYGPDRRGDRRAARWAGLGIAATLLVIAVVVARNAELKTHLFDRTSPPRLMVHWDKAAVDRVTVEQPGVTYQEFAADRGGVALVVPLGPYVVRGLKDGREVYREEFALTDAGHGVSMFEPPAPGSDFGLVAVACDDSTVEITVTSNAGAGDPRNPASAQVVRAMSTPVQTVVLAQPGQPSRRRQPLRPTAEYRLTIVRGDQLLHAETVRLKAGQVLELIVPPIVRPDRTVALKPKAGAFPNEVTRMKLSADRSAVAVGLFAGPIVVFDTVTGQERFTIDRSRTNCSAFGFSPDGRRLAFLTRTGEDSHVLRTADARTGQPVGPDLDPPSGQPFADAHALAFSPDGTRLAVASYTHVGSDNRIRSRILRWERPTGTGAWAERPTLQWQDGTIGELRFTPTGSEVRAVSDEPTWIGWDWQTGEGRRRLDVDQDPTFDRLAVGGPVEAVAGWGRGSPRPVVWFDREMPWGREFRHAADVGPLRIAGLAVSPDGKLAAAGMTGTAATGRWEDQAAVRLWETATGKSRAVLVGHADWPMDIAFDGTGLVTAGKDGTVRYWKVP